MTVKQIIIKWKRESKVRYTPFPVGIYFMETTHIDAKAFKALATKFNIQPEDFYIENIKKEGGPLPLCINFRL